jgi:hypothetical protein
VPPGYGRGASWKGSPSACGFAWAPLKRARRAQSGSRNRAAVSEGLGRPPQVEETPAPRLPATVAKVEALSWDDLRALAAIHEPDLIRLEIASLSEEQKRVLREALADSAAA